MKYKSNFLRRARKISLSIILVLFFLCTIDYIRTTHNFQKPFFAIWTDMEKDGGSGNYTGIGYTIEIEGNFMPEDEAPGVTHARFFLLGKEIKYAKRGK